MADPNQDAADRSDQLRLLTDSVASFAAGKLTLARARKLRRAQPEFDPAMMAELAGQGWTGLLLPEDAGGFGLGFSEARAVIEGVAAQLAPEPLVPVAVLAAGVLRRCAAAAARDSLIEELVGGSAVPGLAWQNASGDLDPAAPAFAAKQAGEGWTVDGEARFVRPGTGATHYLLAAADGKGIALFVVEPGSAGLDVVAEPQADGTSLARVKAKGVRVAGEARLTVSVDDFSAALDEAVLMNAAELLGLINRMRAMTLDYLKTRVQFGKPIGTFQALQHRAVDMLLHEELTRAALDFAVAGFDSGASAHERASLASRAKARAADAAVNVAREAIQMHGGIGVTDEYDLSLYVNRTLSLAPWLGNATFHRRRYVRLNPPTVESEE
ncbi:MAG: acyl-CoA dehydrogenase family protein [Panacagrimonas sp.]